MRGDQVPTLSAWNAFFLIGSHLPHSQFKPLEFRLLLSSPDKGSRGMTLAKNRIIFWRMVQGEESRESKKRWRLDFFRCKALLFWQVKKTPTPQNRISKPVLLELTTGHSIRLMFHFHLHFLLLRKPINVPSEFHSSEQKQSLLVSGWKLWEESLG